MKFLKFSLTAVLSLALCMGFTACSDNDEPDGNGNAGNAFLNGVPTQIGDVTITTDAKGRVTSMKNTDDECDVTIQYGAFSRATNFDAKMTIKDWDTTQPPIEFYFQLNKKGFITYALEIESNGEDEWWFDYNADNQLIYMKRSEGGNEVTNITYTNGDITSVKMRDQDNEGGDWTITYGTTPIANKGCIMLFDETFGIDMDEMMYGYIAGLLGNATKNLPAKNDYVGHYSYGAESDTDVFTWKLNDNGFPTLLTVSEPGSSYTSTYEIRW